MINLFNKKAEFKMANLIIGMIMISAIFGLYFLYINEIGNDYGVTGIIKPELENTYNKFNEEKANIDSMFESIKEPEGLGFVGAAGTLLKSAWNVVLLILTSPIRLHAILVAMITDFGIPSEVGNIGLILIYIFVLIQLTIAIVNYLSRGGKPL